MAKRRTSNEAFKRKAREGRIDRPKTVVLRPRSLASKVEISAGLLPLKAPKRRKPLPVGKDHEHELTEDAAASPGQGSAEQGVSLRLRVADAIRPLLAWSGAGCADVGPDARATMEEVIDAVATVMTVDARFASSVSRPALATLSRVGRLWSLRALAPLRDEAGLLAQP